MSSPFFKDLLSLPQPPDAEIVDRLPVVSLPENAGLLNSLIPLLYPVTPVIPDSYQKVFALLAACQKYEIESVESNIRSAMKQGKFPAPVKAEGFSAYAIANAMGLVPEAEDAACLTLDQPMTFESLGEGLRSFKGRTLCDLIHYRGKNTQSLQQGGGVTVEGGRIVGGGGIVEGVGNVEIGMSFGIGEPDFTL
jgi:hypothetical protein